MSASSAMRGAARERTAAAGTTRRSVSGAESSKLGAAGIVISSRAADSRRSEPSRARRGATTMFQPCVPFWSATRLPRSSAAAAAPSAEPTAEKFTHASPSSSTSTVDGPARSVASAGSRGSEPPETKARPARGVTTRSADEERLEADETAAGGSETPMVSGTEIE